jgi:hypothetical protein
MNTITITKDGSVICNGEKAEKEILPYLSYRVELEEGFTLRSYFRMIQQYPLLEKLNPFFSSFMQQYGTSDKTDTSEGPVDFLELSKTVEMIGYPGSPRLEVYISFRGIAGKENMEIKFFQIQTLLNVPVKLGNLKHVIFGDKVDIFEFDTFYNFFEFIDGIAWELSFHGAPAKCELRR